MVQVGLIVMKVKPYNLIKLCHCQGSYFLEHSVMTWLRSELCKEVKSRGQVKSSEYTQPYRCTSANEKKKVDNHCCQVTTNKF